jgi:hypothetical protein
MIPIAPHHVLCAIIAHRGAQARARASVATCGIRCSGSGVRCADTSPAPIADTLPPPTATTYFRYSLAGGGLIWGPQHQCPRVRPQPQPPVQLRLVLFHDRPQPNGPRGQLPYSRRRRHLWRHDDGGWPTLGAPTEGRLEVSMRGAFAARVCAAVSRRASRAAAAGVGWHCGVDQVATLTQLQKVMDFAGYLQDTLARITPPGFQVGAVRVPCVCDHPAPALGASATHGSVVVTSTLSVVYLLDSW